jgi:hypothetical protein
VWPKPQASVRWGVGAEHDEGLPTGDMRLALPPTFILPLKGGGKVNGLGQRLG